MKATRRCLPAFALGALLLSGCATGNLLEWAKGAPSVYNNPQPHQDTVVRAGGTVLAFPVAVAWDIVTFPLQWIWGVYPFGTKERPEDENQ